MDIWEIIRRWHERHSISQIAQGLGYDRKTVRSYIRLARACGLCLEKPLPPKEDVLLLLKNHEPALGRSSTAQELLGPYLGEISQLVNDPELALTPKSAFLVVCERHGLTDKVSYSSFKRFVASHREKIDPLISTCRLEVSPGTEVQIDYAKIGLFFDALTERRRTLYAFIGTLSHSRLKYIELTFTQDQVSFVSSHVRMFEFFGGVPKRVVLDNLKSGVIKPDLYDPLFNRSYHDMAEHYGCFLDPARVARPKDKGKVERDVQTVREAIRRILVLNPSILLGELNRAALTWSRQDYGMRHHGTTREKPLVVFTERERPALKPLPESPFEVSCWKQATVHPDHYIQFRGKAFSVPSAYVTKKVWIQATEHLLKVFHDERLIAQHVITRSYRHTDHRHFPENIRAVLDKSSIHQHLVERARTLGGEDFYEMIKHLFDIDAFVNLRRAQGLVSVAEQADGPALVSRAARFMRENRVRVTPRKLRCVLEKLCSQDEQYQASLYLAELSEEFVRDISYFINHQQQEGNA
jgi:transposase